MPNICLIFLYIQIFLTCYVIQCIKVHTDRGMEPHRIAWKKLQRSSQIQVSIRTISCLLKCRFKGQYPQPTWPVDLEWSRTRRASQYHSLGNTDTHGKGLTSPGKDPALCGKSGEEEASLFTLKRWPPSLPWSSSHSKPQAEIMGLWSPLLPNSIHLCLSGLFLPVLTQSVSYFPSLIWRSPCRLSPQLDLTHFKRPCQQEAYFNYPEQCGSSLPVLRARASDPVDYANPHLCEVRRFCFSIYQSHMRNSPLSSAI